ncbi:MAG: DUF1489 family protein [Erythrobacter sp.]|nr:DUF1489 family protein [Erythrobacter sp.]
MPLNITKIAFGAQNFSDIEEWYAGRSSFKVNTRYRPTRWEETIGGSLFWIHEHNLVARSTILGYEQQDNGKWWILIEPKLVRVEPQPRRAHQGWRYLKGDPPRDLAEGEAVGDLMPGALAGKLQRMGLI